MNENPNLNLELTLAEVNSILAGLLELPAKVANPLMDKITKQAKAQLDTSTEAKAELVDE